jgi:predicted phosphodiesterase
MNVDAVAICGDITENALPVEWNKFFDIFKQCCWTKELFLVPGNMDGVYCQAGQNIFFQAYERYAGKNNKSLYFAHETDDCFMIGISPENDSEVTISDKQLAVLEESIRKADERDIPALVFSHYQLSNTINVNWKYATLGSESEKIKSILEKYCGKVILFSGHIHRGLIAETGGSLIKIKNVTYASTPSICKPDIKHYKADNNCVGTGFVVELSKSHVLIRGYDFLQQKWLNDFYWTV